MSDSYKPIRGFLDAAAREFNDIVDALARASCASPIIDAGAAGEGALLPVQVVACFRTSELDNLFGPAVQCAAASPLKDLLLPLLKRMRELQHQLRSKAIRAEDDESDLPGGFLEKYCGAVSELRSYIGAAGTDAVSAERTAKEKNQPRGRKQRYDRERDKTVAEKWQRARDDGTSEKTFARDNGMSVSQFRRLKNRVRRHKNRADK